MASSERRSRGADGPEKDVTLDIYVNRLAVSLKEGNSDLNYRQLNKRKIRVIKQFLYFYSSREQLRKCGNVSRRVEGVGIVARKNADGSNSAGLSGLSSCHSVWLCPTCGPRIAFHRAREIREIMTAWAEREKGQFLFLTLTMKHKKSDALDDLWKAISQAWTRFSRHYSFKKHSNNGSGMGGWLKATEVTHGSNGWHVHLHVLIFVRDPLPMISDTNKLFLRWGEIVESEGFSADPGAQDMRFANPDDVAVLAGYLNKQRWDSAKEMTAQAGKIAKGESVTPMQILWSAVQGEDAARSLWYVFEHASMGKRQLTWSAEPRKSLGFGLEKPDQDIEISSSMEVAGIRPEFFAMFRHRHDEMAQFLEAAEEADTAVRLRKLRALAVHFDLPLDVGSKWDKIKFDSTARGSNYKDTASETPKIKILRNQVLKEWLQS